MKKFFLFKRKDIDISSLETSDTGEGLDVFCVTADLFAFMTASAGRVNIVFNNATIYEESNLVDGESFQKTSVAVACEEGKEFALIESIMYFIYSTNITSNVMRFDAVEGKTNVKGANIQKFDDVKPSVRTHPVFRNTGKISKKTFIGGTSGTTYGTNTIIDKIDFGNADNVPLVDYNQENFTLSGTEITAWANDSSSTGGSTYNLTSLDVGGTYKIDVLDAGRLDSGFKTRAAEIRSNEGFSIANEILIDGPFTIYTVFGLDPVTQGTNVIRPRIYGNKPTQFNRTVDQPTSATNKIIFEDENSFYGVNLGDLVYDGFTLLGTVTALDPDGDNSKEIQISATNTITDNDNLTFVSALKPALKRTCEGFQSYPTKGSQLSFDIAFDENKSETINVKVKDFYDYDSPEKIRETCFVLIMRRDIDNNLFFHDKNGTLIHTVLYSKGKNPTDGKLRINNVGAGYLKKGTYNITRFGVIESDIGRNNASELAIDLFDRYNP